MKSRVEISAVADPNFRREYRQLGIRRTFRKRHAVSSPRPPAVMCDHVPCLAVLDGAGRCDVELAIDCFASARPQSAPLLTQVIAFGLFPGSILGIVEPLEKLNTVIGHSLIHDIAIDHTKLLPDSHLDIGSQLNWRTGIQIEHFPHGFLLSAPSLIRCLRWWFGLPNRVVVLAEMCVCLRPQVHAAGPTPHERRWLL
jgi:hypothetical protein